jgi:ABC-type multidrug transport system fused ATPase/permease subunit
LAFLFFVFVEENIRRGTRDEVSQEDVETAAKKANAHDFIVKVTKKKK